VPTEPPTDTDPQRYLLSTVRQSQATVIDTIRTWTTITEQLTRTLRVPVPEVDFAGAVDRVFDVAEQTLAAQRQLALTVAGVATRQVDTALETVDTAVAAVETTVGTGRGATGPSRERLLNDPGTTCSIATNPADPASSPSERSRIHDYSPGRYQALAWRNLPKQLRTVGPYKSRRQPPQ
jgi:hypothetical protein